ncbi:MAG: M16 family metallopeptidase [Myxococcota bacterium]
MRFQLSTPTAPVKPNKPSTPSTPNMPTRTPITKEPIMRGLISIALALSLQGCALFEPKPAWEEPPPPPAERAIVDAEDFTRTTLPNGIEVLVLEDHRLPRATVGITLRRGAGSVAPEQAGLAEIATEVMQRGAGDRDALALARVVEDAGASLSVAAGWDTTRVSMSGLSSDRDLLFSILEDVVMRPRFDASEFEKARGEQLAGLQAALDDPATLVRWHTLKVLYPGHRYGLPMTGTAETLARLTPDAARRYWSERRVPGSMIFWAVGDLSADEVVAEVRARFGSIAAAEAVSATPPVPAKTPAQRRIVVVDKPDLGQARIILAHEGIERTESKRIPVDLMNDALGGSGFSSRLMITVRSDAGLTYGIGSGYSLRSEAGPFSISTFTRVPEVRRVIDLVLGEMEAIRGGRPIDEEELSKFISYNVGRFGLGLETSEAVLGSIVDLRVHGLPDDSLDTFRGRVRDVTLADVAEAAQTRLHPDRAAIIVLGPADQIAPQLESLGDVEIVQP